MHANLVAELKHAHDFVAHHDDTGERRTWWVIGLTLVMMVGELVAGQIFGSIALTADGWHMATHAAALSIAAFAYRFSRKRAHDRRFSFGPGKVNALGGFASAVALGVVALLVLGECLTRLWNPHAVHYPEALSVAVLGLVVNLVSALILHHDHDHHHDDHIHHHHDHNLRGAYLHVLADALTSLLAIGALVAGWMLGWTWTDPVAGLVGGIVIAHWSLGLLRATSRVLLDAEADEAQREAVAAQLESDDDTQVADLHLWRVGPSHLAVIAVVVTHHDRTPEDYKARLRSFRDLVHLTIEVHRCDTPCSLETGT